MNGSGMSVCHHYSTIVVLAVVIIPVVVGGMKEAVGLCRYLVGASWGVVARASEVNAGRRLPRECLLRGTDAGMPGVRSTRTYPASYRTDYGRRLCAPLQSTTLPSFCTTVLSYLLYFDRDGPLYILYHIVCTVLCTNTHLTEATVQYSITPTSIS